MKVVDIVYHSHNDFASTTQVIEKHASAFGYIPYLKDRLDIQLIKHFKIEVKKELDGITTMFFKRRNKFWSIPFRTHRYIRSVSPDVVIIEGLIFPLQLIVLKLLLKRSCKFVVQHHGEAPYRGYKRVIQKIADKCVGAYMFTAKGNTEEWLKKGVIKDEMKCHEILEASTYISAIDKLVSRNLLAIEPGVVFLWVGRLNENKDPLTVLGAFEKYVEAGYRGVLYMIYHTTEMLPQIEARLNDNKRLANAVKLVGKVSHDQMSLWYSAADLYLSASHRECCGYALIEAMACGCIPVVTSIPSFKKITNNGEIGYLYPPSDVDYLFNILRRFGVIDLKQSSEQTLRYFRDNLSFECIAEDIYQLCSSLYSK